jgi:hypothetical protein
MGKKKPFTFDNHLTEIRKTFDRGRRDIILEGRRFAMKLQITYYKDPETQQRHKNEWITIHPMDGALVPCASIERKHLGNLRSAR